MTSSFGLHIIYDGIDGDLNPLRVAIATLQPRVINIVSGAKKAQAFSFAIEMLKKYPAMRVIYRDWPDDGLHAIDKYKLTWHRDAFGSLIVDDYSGCQRWIDDHANFLLAGLTVLTDNESVNDHLDVYAAWQAKIMDLCGAKGWKVAVGRFAVGNPREADYARMGAMWRALAKWHPLHTFSPNEYLPQDIRDASGMLGRYIQGIDAAKKIGAWPFDVSIGEYGVVYRKPDGGLDADAGYSDPRIGWSGDKAFHYLHDAWKQWYKPYGVDVCVYCWGGDGSARWGRFRVDTDNGFIKALTDANNRGELEPMAVVPTPPLTPNYTPVAFVANEKYTLVIKGAYRNVREATATNAKIVGQVNNGAEIIALKQEIVGADYWWKIQADDVIGYVSLDGGAVEFRRIVPPVVVPAPAPFLEVSPEKAKRMSDMYASLADTYAAMVIDHRNLAAEWLSIYEQTKLDNAA